MPWSRLHAADCAACSPWTTKWRTAMFCKYGHEERNFAMPQPEYEIHRLQSERRRDVDSG